MGIGDWEFGTERRLPAGFCRQDAGAPGARFKPGDPELARRRCMIVGLGRTGVSALRYLRSAGAQVCATDCDHARAEVAGEAWRRPGEALSALAATDLLVVSPGIPPDFELVVEARKRGIEIVGDIELFARAVSSVSSSRPPVPIIAVTGTNGKSTVASLVAAMAACAGRRVAVGANLGTPALDLIAPGVEVYVLELSSFQLELTDSLAPMAAAVLNVSADHLDRYRSLEAYGAAKARIYTRAETAIANRDDPVVLEMVRDRVGAVSFGLDEPAGAGDFGLRECGGEIVLCRGEERLIAAREVPLAGRHNLANALAAWALGAAVGLPDAPMREALRAFRPLPHRLAPVRSRRGVRYLDDSKATNVSAACAGLAGLSGPLVVIAGGEGKGQDFAPFADCLTGRARAVILIGAAAEAIEAAIAGRVPAVRAGSMDAAVAAAAARAESGDCVVLAPACSSLDMFRNYAARGEAFVRAVEALDGD